MAQIWPRYGPKCELPKLVIRHNIGPISAANSRLLLLGQCHHLQWSSVGLTTAAFVDFLNLPILSRNLAQYRPYAKPIVTFTMAYSSSSRVCARIDRQVHTEVIIPATAQYWQLIFSNIFADAGPVLGRF